MISKEEIESIENAAIESAANMGPAKDIFHSDYGWIMRDGELTEAGKRFFEEKINKNENHNS